MALWHSSTDAGPAAALRVQARRPQARWALLPPNERAWLTAPLVGAVIMAATLVNRPLYRWLTHEDGPIEWAQVAMDLAASVGAAVVAAALLRRGQRVAAALWLVFALSQFFIAGEEISWGQRIFDTQTPAELARLNHQTETNIHNIRPVQDTINVVFMVIGFYGSIGALALRRRIPRRRRPAWFDLFVPPTKLFTLFALVFSYKLLRLAVFQEPRFVIVKFGEYIELCTGTALAAFAWMTARDLRRGGHGAGDPKTTSGTLGKGA